MGAIEELRNRLGNALPQDLNTEFNLQRWISAYDQDLDACSAKFAEYLMTRRQLGYDKPESTEAFYQRPLIRKYGRFLAQTKINGKWINSLDNGIIFVEMPIENPSKFLKAVRVSEYLQIFFGFCEHFQNLVLAHEKKTGRRSHAICIFDQKGSSITPYINPIGAISRLMMSRIHLWLDYYSELLNRVIIVNSPTFLLPFVWKAVSILLPSKVLSRFTIATDLPRDLLPYLSIECIPVAYGGTYSVPDALDNTCVLAESITPLDYQESGWIWKQNSLSTECETVTVKASGFYQKSFNMLGGQTIFYEYFTNGELQFWISEGEKILTPKFRHTTLKLSEEGKVKIAANGILSINITNPSKMFTVKVHLSYAVL